MQENDNALAPLALVGCSLVAVALALGVVALVVGIIVIGSLTPPAPAPMPTAEPPPLPTAEAAPAAASLYDIDLDAFVWATYSTNFDNPVQLVHAGDGSRRLFGVEQTGLVWVMKDGETLPEPFLDISPLLPADVFRGGYTERGLLGFAFHPDYAQNGTFFVHYSDLNGETVIARYQVSDDPNRADPASAVRVLQVDQPFADHNGGQIAFGPDGYLYIGLGDGGNPSDPPMNAQRTSSLLGKILRIDVNADTYTIPPDNPFVGRAGYAPEIWALGLRNPWRFSFDRLTGDLYVGDVGQWLYEEINFQPAGVGGLNYGWELYEASQPSDVASVDRSVAVDVTFPVIEYDHQQGCSVIGGFVYRGALLPELDGVYIYGDYCNGRIWLARQRADGTWQNRLWVQTNYQITSFGEDEAGELYLVNYKGDIMRLEHAAS